MRNVLLGLLAISALALSARPANACGGYGGPPPGPEVLLLSTHLVDAGAPGQSATRTFALLDERAPERLAWRAIARMTYDSTELADAKPTPEVVTLTLVGPSGVRVVSSRQRAYVKTFRVRAGRAAVELAGVSGRYRVALPGRVRDVAWIALSHEAATQHDVAWLGTQGHRAVREEVFAASLPGRDARALVVHAADGAATTLVRGPRGWRARLDGTAIGALELGGRVYVLAERDGIVRGAWI